jgi:photosystem II stability/assembly factor-like uncharacterized protein
MSLYTRKLFFVLPVCLLFFSCKKDVLEPKEASQIVVPATHDLNSIVFVNDTLGFIAGGEKYENTEILTTTDGGKTWSRFYLDQDGSKGVYGLTCYNSKVYGVGYDGKFYREEAPGQGWQIIQTAYWEWFQSLTFTQANKGFIVSGEGYRAGRLYSTDSMGNLSLIDTFEFQLVDIRFANDQVGYISGYGSVLKTEDGGSTWILQDVKGDLFRSVSCVDQNNVWIVGYNGTIVHTSDGGTNWEHQRNGDNPLLKKYRLRAVAFKDLHTGYAAGDKGIILKTTDGGAHWIEFKHLTDNDFKCLTIHPDGSLWLAGTDGMVFHIRE